MHPNQNRPLVSPPAPQPTGQYLTHLFVAEFADGTSYQQNPEDISLIDPAKSSYYDIALRKDEVVRFSITDGMNWYTVDLRDGAFEVNGLPFEAHDQFATLPEKMELVYFREWRHEYPNVNQTPNRYFIGWEGKTRGGKNIKQTIAIPG